MRYGIAFYGTGAAAPTAHNVTLKDPVLEATITTVVMRGSQREQSICGISFGSDVPALGSRLELRIGNQPTPARVIDLFPYIDLNLASEQVHNLNYMDLGGIPIKEDELIDIRIYDPGAAEFMNGVLWLEDYEPEIPIPQGNLVTLKFGGTNDVTTSMATTGFDMDSRKLSNDRLYTPFDVVVRPEDQSLQWLILRADKDVMTLPQSGRMVFKTAPLQFKGQQYNSGQVIGKAQAQAATKVEIVMRCIESDIGGPALNAPPITGIRDTGLPGILGPSSVVKGGPLQLKAGAPGPSPVPFKLKK